MRDSSANSKKRRLDCLRAFLMKKNTNNPLIVIQHLTKKIGKATLLHDISFSLAKGEVFGFL